MNERLAALRSSADRILGTPMRKVTVGLAVALLLMVWTVPATRAAFVAKITNASVATTNPYFTCTAADVAGGAYYAYPLDDNITLTARDVSGNARTGTYGLAPTHSASSPCTRDGGGSTTFNGTTQYATTPNLLTGPQVFTVEIWFRCTTAGGQLVGFNNAQTGAGGSYDRHIYMTNAGTLTFGVYPNAVQTVTSPATYNDGAWHHTAATLDSTGMKLYVDGALVASSTNTVAQTFNGYWRIAYGNLNGWPSPPSSLYFNGQLGYFAYYPTALSASTIAAHYRSGT